MGSAIFGASMFTALLVPDPGTLCMLMSGPSKPVTVIFFMVAFVMLANEIPFLQVPETFFSVKPSKGLFG